MRTALYRILTAMALVAIGGAAHAQGTYKTNSFSVDFNGPVQTKAYRNDANTSTRTAYSSCSGDICEGVTVVAIDHDIDVNMASAEFYRNSASDNEFQSHTDVNSEGYYQGHPYAYGNYTSTINGVEYEWFERFIVVNSREVVFIYMSIPSSDYESGKVGKSGGGSTYAAWQTFEYTLNLF